VTASAPATSLPVRRAALIIAGLAISVVAIWIVTRGVDLERTSAIVTAAAPGWLLVALVVVAGQTIVRAIRWRLLLPPPIADAGLHGRSPSILRIVPVLLIGYLGNAVLPARLGEAARAVLIARRERLPVPQTLGSVVLERVLDTLVLALLGISAALIIGVPDWVIRIGLVGVALSIAAVAVLSIAPRLLRRLSGGPLHRLVSGISAIVHGANVAKRPAAISGALLLSLMAWLLDASIYWLVGRSLGLDLSPVGATLIATVTVLSTAVPSAPGYVGTFELAAVAAASVVGFDPTTALAFAIVAHAVAVLPIALAGAVALVALGADARLLLGTSADNQSKERGAVTPL
jgi:uncharacterized membrane protein YbhN (UPF0104 family)